MATMTEERARWTGTAEYAHLHIRGADEARFEEVAHRAGLHIDHTRFLPHAGNRPTDAQHLDTYLFVFLPEPSEEPWKPTVEDVSAAVMKAAGVEGIVNGHTIKLLLS
jgi:hypothetical protein